MTSCLQWWRVAERQPWFCRNSADPSCVRSFLPTTSVDPTCNVQRLHQQQYAYEFMTCTMLCCLQPAIVIQSASMCRANACISVCIMQLALVIALYKYVQCMTTANLQRKDIMMTVQKHHNRNPPTRTFFHDSLHKSADST